MVKPLKTWFNEEHEFFPHCYFGKKYSDIERKGTYA